MPKILLKPNSPEYAEKTQKVKHTCEMPGCKSAAEFRAPKDRTLKEYYNFCQEHTREYNRAWNYFADMSDEEIQKDLYENLYGYRPTHKYGAGQEYIDELYRKAWQTYNYRSDEIPRSERFRRTAEEFIEEYTPEKEALHIMELDVPITLTDIKKRYKELAKKYHPDLNPNDKDAEEQLKKVNMAYTILKVAYEKFEKLEAK